MRIYKSLLMILLFFSSYAQAHSWDEHLGEVEELERNIYKYQQELDVLIEEKKNTREKARIEQTLQRIVEIHAELISLRKNMDTVREHLKAEHPGKAHILDQYDSRVRSANKQKKRYSNSPLSGELDQLLIKVQLKFASFMHPEDKKEEILEVEKVMKVKRKQKKEREADVYLRKRSKVRLVK